MSKQSRNDGKQWTSEADARLKALNKKEEALSKIAKELGRTESAARDRLTKEHQEEIKNEN